MERQDVWGENQLSPCYNIFFALPIVLVFGSDAAVIGKVAEILTFGLFVWIYYDVVQTM